MGKEGLDNLIHTGYIEDKMARGKLPCVLKRKDGGAGFGRDG